MAEPRGKRLLEGSDAILGIEQTDGSCEAEAFIQKQPKQVQARYKRYLERLRDGLPVKNPEHMRPLDSDSLGNEMHELKNHSPSATRLYIMKLGTPTNGTKWIATHGGPKPKKVETEIKNTWTKFYNWLDGERQSDVCIPEV
ncbi:hypothetical protein ABIC52_000449 [Curtobacterium oceanosedimentum]